MKETELVLFPAYSVRDTAMPGGCLLCRASVSASLIWRLICF